MAEPPSAKAGSDTDGILPQQLAGAKAIAATAACSLVLVLSFAAPIIRLATWMFQEAQTDRGTPLTGRFIEFASNSLVLAAATAFASVLIALLLTNTARLGREPVD